MFNKKNIIDKLSILDIGFEAESSKIKEILRLANISRASIATLDIGLKYEDIQFQKEPIEFFTQKIDEEIRSIEGMCIADIEKNDSIMEKLHYARKLKKNFEPGGFIFVAYKLFNLSQKATLNINQSLKHEIDEVLTILLNFRIPKPWFI